MLNIVIPMAGKGSRFADAGYTDPKPLIEIHGVPMIQLVIFNLRPVEPHRFIFICQRAHVDAYDLAPKLSRWAPGSEIVMLDGITEGAACTVLAAHALIDSDEPLMIANSDQYVDIGIDAYLTSLSAGALDGLIMTMRADDPKWSFVAIDEHRMATRVAEKIVISNDATVGIYNFARGADFVDAARAMIADDERVNGEFYVAPVYNRLIASGHRIGIFDIGAENAGMYGLGIPTDLKLFLENPISIQAAEKA